MWSSTVRTIISQADQSDRLKRGFRRLAFPHFSELSPEFEIHVTLAVAFETGFHSPDKIGGRLLEPFSSHHARGVEGVGGCDGKGLRGELKIGQVRDFGKFDRRFRFGVQGRVESSLSSPPKLKLSFGATFGMVRRERCAGREENRSRHLA